MRLNPLLRRAPATRARHRRAVGGMWEEIGLLQRDFLLAQGLEPGHRLLDIGCGSLRGGIHAIRYLESGHYYGVDRSGDLLRAGRNLELPLHGLADRRPHLLENNDFEFGRFGVAFDFALAQSVFTHLPFNRIMRCLVEVANVLKPRGRLFATFFEQSGCDFTNDPILHPAAEGVRPIRTYPDADPYHHPVRLFQAFCAASPLEFRYVGEWGHPRGQRMLEFRRL